MTLSPRMVEIAALIAEHDLTVREIAVRLEVAPRTVRGYIEDAGRRLPGPHRPRIKLIIWWVQSSRVAA